MPDAYRNTSRLPQDLNDGRIVAPGDQVDVDTGDQWNARLIDEGVLVPIETKRAAAPKPDKGDN
jgi:hypothetical protein